MFKRQSNCVLILKIRWGSQPPEGGIKTFEKRKVLLQWNVKLLESNESA